MPSNSCTTRSNATSHRTNRPRGPPTARRCSAFGASRVATPNWNRRCAPRPELQPHLAGALLTGVATIAAEHGRTDEAREVLDAVLASGPFADGNDLMIPLHAAQIAEAAVAAGHAAGRRARRPRAGHAGGRRSVCSRPGTCASVPSTARAAMSPGPSAGSTTRSSATNGRSTSRKRSARGSTRTAHGSGSRTRSPRATPTATANGSSSSRPRSSASPRSWARRWSPTAPGRSFSYSPGPRHRDDVPSHRRKTCPISPRRGRIHGGWSSS